MCIRDSLCTGRRLRARIGRFGLKALADGVLEQRFRPAGETQPGNTVEPRQRFLRVATMEVDYPIFTCHYCMRP